MAVSRRDRQHLRGDVFRQLFGELRRIGQQHLRDALKLRRVLRRVGCVVAGNQHMHIAAASQRRGHRVAGCALEAAMFVFGNDERRHGQITFASFLSFATSVATSGTFTPALRLGGSLTLRVFRRGVTSTPSSSGLKLSSGFFLAFMMLGSVT